MRALPFFAQSGTFPVRHRDLRKDRGVTQLELSYAMRDADWEGKGYAPSFIAQVERGEKRPPERYMRLLNLVLSPTLEEMPEVQLAGVRAMFDENQVGLDAALYNLAQIRDVRLGEFTDEDRDQAHAALEDLIDRERRARQEQQEQLETPTQESAEVASPVAVDRRGNE